MRLMKINCRSIWYALYQSTVLLSTPGQEYKSGERASTYGKPVKSDNRMNVSAVVGSSIEADFGTYDDYSVVMLTQDMSCPIDEHSLLWVDVDPELDENGDATVPHDYIVKHVAKTLNVIAYALEKVDKGYGEESN